MGALDDYRAEKARELTTTWSGLSFNFNLAFVASLGNEDKTASKGILSEWQKIGGVLPFKDMTPEVHERLTECMQQCLGFGEGTQAIAERMPLSP